MGRGGRLRRGTPLGGQWLIRRPRGLAGCRGLTGLGGWRRGLAGGRAARAGLGGVGLGRAGLLRRSRLRWGRRRLRRRSLTGLGLARWRARGIGLAVWLALRRARWLVAGGGPRRCGLARRCLPTRLVGRGLGARLRAGLRARLGRSARGRPTGPLARRGLSRIRWLRLVRTTGGLFAALGVGLRAGGRLGRGLAVGWSAVALRRRAAGGCGRLSRRRRGRR